MSSIPSSLVAEYLGTFFFIMAIFMSGGNPLIIGGALAVVIMFIGSVSGGHVYPAVSISQYLMCKLSASDLSAYILAQVLGGISAYYAYRMAK